MPRANPLAAVLVIGAVAALLLRAPLHPQEACPLSHGLDCHPIPPERGSTVSGHLTGATINALLGGISAAVRGASNDQPLAADFVAGSLGGLVHYGGKVAGSRRLPAAGLVGRQIAAVGSGIIDAAAEGRPAFQMIPLALGPVYLYVAKREEDGWQIVPAVDALTTGATAYALLRGARLDAARSLSAGNVVLTKERFHDLFGGHTGTFAGLIIYTRDQPFRRNFAHERVHVFQYDWANIVWSRPLEHSLLRLDAESEGFPHLGLYVVLKPPLHGMLEYSKRPWEREAFFLMRN